MLKIQGTVSMPMSMALIILVLSFSLAISTVVADLQQSAGSSFWSTRMPVDNFTVYIDPARQVTFDCRNYISESERRAFSQQSAVSEGDLRVYWTFDGVLVATPLFDGITFTSEESGSTIQFDLTRFRPLNSSNYESIIGSFFDDFVQRQGNESELQTDLLLRSLTNLNSPLAPLDRVARAAFLDPSSWRSASSATSENLRSRGSSPFPSSSTAAEPSTATTTAEGLTRIRSQLIEALWSKLNLSAQSLGPSKFDADRSLLGPSRLPYAGMLRCGLFASPEESETLLFLSRPVFVQPAYLARDTALEQPSELEVVTGGTVQFSCVLPNNSRPSLRFVRWERQSSESLNFTEVNFETQFGDGHRIEWLTPEADGSVVVTGASEELAGTYRCVGINDALQLESYGPSIQLNITSIAIFNQSIRFYQAHPLAHVESKVRQKVKVIEGDRIKLLCSSPQMSFTRQATERCFWTRVSTNPHYCTSSASKHVAPVDRLRTALNGQLVEVSNVSLCDIGMLRCQCFGVGDAQRLSFDLELNWPPKAKLEPTNASPNGFDVTSSAVQNVTFTFTSLAGQTAQLKCAVASRAERTVVWWFRNGVLVSADEQSSVADGSAARAASDETTIVAGSSHSRSQIARTSRFEDNNRLRLDYSCPSRTRDKVCSELRILNVDLSDAGLYQCVVANEFGYSTAFSRLVVRSANRDPIAARTSGSNNDANAFRTSPSNSLDASVVASTNTSSSAIQVDTSVNETVTQDTLTTKKRRKTTRLMVETTTASTVSNEIVGDQDPLVMYGYVEDVTVLSPTSVFVQLSYSIQLSSQLVSIPWSEVQTMKINRRRRSVSSEEESPSLPSCADAPTADADYLVDLNSTETTFKQLAAKHYQKSLDIDLRSLVVYLRYTLVEDANAHLVRINFEQFPTRKITGLRAGGTYKFDVLICDRRRDFCLVEPSDNAIETAVQCSPSNSDGKATDSEEGEEYSEASSVDARTSSVSNPIEDRSEEDSDETNADLQLPRPVSDENSQRQPSGKKPSKGGKKKPKKAKTRRPKVVNDIEKRPTNDQDQRNIENELLRQVAIVNVRSIRHKSSASSFVLWNLLLNPNSNETFVLVPPSLPVQFSFSVFFTRVNISVSEISKSEPVIEVSNVKITVCSIPEECLNWTTCFVHVYGSYMSNDQSERTHMRSSEKILISVPDELDAKEIRAELDARGGPSELFAYQVRDEQSNPFSFWNFYFIVPCIAIGVIFVLLTAFTIVCVLKQRRRGSRKRAASRAAMKHRQADTDMNVNGSATDPLCAMQTHKTATLTRIKPHANGYLLNGLANDYNQSQVQLAGPPQMQRYNSIPGKIGGSGLAEVARAQAEAHQKLMSPHQSMAMTDMNAVNGFSRGNGVVYPAGVGPNPQMMPLLQTALVEQNEDANSVDGELMNARGFPNNGGIVPIQTGTLQKKAMLVTTQNGSQLASAAYYPSGTPHAVRPASSASVRLNQLPHNGMAGGNQNASRAGNFGTQQSSGSTAETNFGGASTLLMAGIPPNGLAAVPAQMRLSNASLMRANSNGGQALANYNGTLPRVVNVPQPVHVAQLQQNTVPQQTSLAVSQPNIAANGAQGLQLQMVGQNGSTNMIAAMNGTRPATSTAQLHNAGQAMVTDGSTSEVSVMSNGSARFRRRKKRHSSRNSPSTAQSGTDSLTREQGTLTLQHAHPHHQSQSTHSLARNPSQNGASFTLPQPFPANGTTQAQFVVNGTPPNQFVNGMDPNGGFVVSPQFFSTPVGHPGGQQVMPSYNGAAKQALTNSNLMMLNQNGQRAGQQYGTQNVPNGDINARHVMNGQQMNGMPNGQQAMLQQYVRSQSPGAGLRRDSPGFFIEPPRVHDFADYTVNH